MSKSNNTRRNIGLLFVFAACVALVCADLVVSSAHSQPQNTNSSTTQEEEPTRGGQMTSNSNMSNDNTSGATNSGRRRRPRRPRRPAANANTSGDMSNMNMSGDMSGQDANANMSGDMSGNMNMGRRRRRGRRNRNTASMQDTNANMSGGTGMMENTSGGTQADLSGTYTGNVNYPEGGLSGPASLTITGNQFTLTPDGGGSPVSGTVTAVTTRGYTGVTMMFGERTQIPVTQAPPPLPAVSLRARMAGGNVTLMSVPGEKREFSFSSGGTKGRKPRRKRAAMTMSSPAEDTGRGMEIKPPTVTSPTP